MVKICHSKNLGMECNGRPVRFTFMKSLVALNNVFFCTNIVVIMVFDFFLLLYIMY